MGCIKMEGRRAVGKCRIENSAEFRKEIIVWVAGDSKWKGVAIVCKWIAGGSYRILSGCWKSGRW